MKVLVIEDDADIALGITTVLSRNGFEVSTAPEGRQGLRTLHGAPPDLVVLDLGLPEMDGWAVLERIRDLSDVPVLILSARGMEADKVRGLRGGADDYLTKPFGNAEFIARVQALLRRNRPGSTRALPDVYDDGTVRVNFASHEVIVDGTPVSLTATEYRLLAALIKHRGQILSPVELLELAWSDPFGVGPDRVKYSVMRLRRKLGADAGAGSPIEAVRGFGYRYRGGGAEEQPATGPRRESRPATIPPPREGPRAAGPSRPSPGGRPCP